MLDEIGREARFATRRHAGRVLAARLRAYAGRDDVLVLGLDLYSLHRSIECVLQYLEKVDPEAAQRARRRYSCFDVFGEDVQDPHRHHARRGAAREVVAARSGSPGNGPDGSLRSCL